MCVLLSCKKNYVLEEVKISNFFHRGLHGKRFIDIFSMGYWDFKKISISPFFTNDELQMEYMVKLIIGG
jgi:hypothetical protein